MRDDAYRLAARHRLGMLPFDNMRTFACVSCATRSKETPTLLVDPDHAHACVLQLGTSVDRRHDCLKMTLASLVRSCDGYHVEVEPRFPPRIESHLDLTTGRVVTTVTPAVDIHGDLLLVRANHHELIDVTVARPTALTHLNASARANPTTVPLAAACDAEQIKHKKYDEECARHGWKLIPFAIESYGALGTSARQLLERMSAHCVDRSPSEFLAHATRLLSVALQTGNAHVALQGATRMATQAYYRGCCPTAVTIRPPGVNQRKCAARTFTKQMASGESMRAIFHRGYQHAAAA